jgi:hypothetical protein
LPKLEFSPTLVTRNVPTLSRILLPEMINGSSFLVAVASMIYCQTSRPDVFFIWSDSPSHIRKRTLSLDLLLQALQSVELNINGETTYRTIESEGRNMVTSHYECETCWRPMIGLHGIACLLSTRPHSAYSISSKTRTKNPPPIHRIGIYGTRRIAYCRASYRNLLTTTSSI